VLDEEPDDLAALFDHEMYAVLMARSLAGLDELVEDYEVQQFEWLYIAPPGPDPWIQPTDVMPFDPAGFPKEFLDGLVGEIEGGIAVYEVYAFEDPDTRYGAHRNGPTHAQLNGPT
jgi:hypothetical protein